MQLNFILGGINCDKTEKCFSMIEKLGGRRLMLVPDQYSYIAERQLCRKFGGGGLNNIEVLTFSRLCYRVKSEISLPDYISTAGKQMLLLRAIRNVCTEDSIFSGCVGKSGFADVMANLIKEFKRYELTCGILAEQAEKMPNETLRRKLAELAAIYSEYEKLLGDRFSDSDNDPDVVAEYIQRTDMFHGVHIFLDEFSDFLPQNYRIIAELIRSAASVNISLCIPADRSFGDDTYDLCRTTYSNLKRIASKLGCPTADIPFDDDMKESRSAELAFLVNNWNVPLAEYVGEVQDISVFQGKNPYSEVEHTASCLLEFVRRTGCRFRDTAVFCPDFMTYGHLIDAVFNQYGIPYFADNKLAITQHPVIVLVLSVFEILTSDWSYESVFRYLRTGFIYDADIRPIDREKTDMLENYVLKYDVHSTKVWLSEEDWSGRSVFYDENGYSDINEAAMDEFRRQIIVPFTAFKKKCHGKKTVRCIAEALFGFLEDIHLPDGIQYEIACLEKSGRTNEAEQFARVWSLLLDTLDQAVTAMDGESCTLEEFGEYIKAGLSQCEIRIIPSSSDSVAVGTVERSRGMRVRALFIIGANYGKIPSDIRNEGILSNNDRELIQLSLDELDMSIAPETKKREIGERYKLFKAIALAKEQLSISYALADAEDSALRPAQFVSDIHAMFPHLTEEDDAVAELSAQERAISCPEASFRRLMYHLDDPSDTLWGSVRQWYQLRPEWNRHIQNIRNFEEHRPFLTKETARLLYGTDDARSVTQFENYSSCPFRYYMRYGLKARPRDMWEIRKADIGTLCHAIVQKYCNRVSEGAESVAQVHRCWQELSEQESGAILGSIIDEVTDKTLAAAIHSKGRLECILRRIRRTVERSVEIINKSLKNSAYAEIACEKQFSQQLVDSLDGTRINLTGIIDRVDLYEADGTAYIRIIDYKSGHKDFDVADIYNRLSLQLITYAFAASEMYRSCDFAPKQGSYNNVQISAVLYNKIRDDIMTSRTNTREGALEEGKKARKLSGLIFADMPEELVLMDKALIEESKSEILNISLKADGKISKLSDVTPSRRSVLLTDFVRRAIIEINREIYSGNIDIFPYKKGSMMPCQFCDYSEVCLTDGTNCRQLVTGKENAWSMIEAEMGE